MKSPGVGEDVDLHVHTASVCVCVCGAELSVEGNVYEGQPLMTISPTGLDLPQPEPCVCCVFRMCTALFVQYRWESAEVAYSCVWACVCVCETECPRLACWHTPLSQCQANTYSTATNVTTLDTYLTHRHSFPAHIQSGIGKPIASTIECVIVSIHHHIKKWHTGLVCGAQIRDVDLSSFDGSQVWHFKY